MTRELPLLAALLLPATPSTSPSSKPASSAATETPSIPPASVPASPSRAASSTATRSPSTVSTPSAPTATLSWKSKSASSPKAAPTTATAPPGTSPGETGGGRSWFNPAALCKSFRFSERLSAQVRAEASNFRNHPLLNNPNTNPRSGDFSRVTSKYNERNLQLGLKIIF
jgi:hypothetical protein